MSDFNHTTHPVARKRHKCEECSRTIDPGETYEKTSAVWEGDFFTSLACMHCAEARRIINRYSEWFNECYYGGLSEWLGDNWQEAVWIARLYACFREDWRFQSAALMPLPADRIPPLLRSAS